MKKKEKNVTFDDLSDEQQNMVDYALLGKNVLVDACIGSGKTTSIQVLCNELEGKRILYLTYNKLLQLDAKDKITNKWTNVLTYHGFAYRELMRIGVKPGQGDQIQKYLHLRPPMSKQYDVLVVDEYQDIDSEIAQMLMCIKEAFPDIQIIAVGDMKQKIYDKTSLDAYGFIQSLLGEHEELSYSICFRISSELALSLGRVWNKSINGVNKNCLVRTMKLKDVEDYLAVQELSDILCLGTRKGKMASVLNDLEDHFPEKFNKHTVYASIKDDGERGNISPDKNTAIFTTFDGCKGLERNICVLFDFTEQNWYGRLNIPNTRYEILRNIFCVAASRGKKEIVIVDEPEHDIVTENILMNIVGEVLDYRKPLNISDMFTMKFKEDIEECFSLIRTKEIPRTDRSEILIKNCDGLIDLSPCIGNFQEAVFFGNYNLDEAIHHSIETHSSLQMDQLQDDATVEEKILYMTAYDTGQDRYYKQVQIPFVGELQADMIKSRLFTEFTSKEEVQIDCSIDVNDEKGNGILSLLGRIDVLKNGMIYELKFVNSLSHEHFLQLACYLVAMNIKKGILWNVRTNQMFEVEVPDKKKFLSSVIKAVTKDNLVYQCEQMLLDGETIAESVFPKTKETELATQSREEKISCIEHHVNLHPTKKHKHKSQKKSKSNSKKNKNKNKKNKSKKKRR